jgi:hypothetical protein
MKKILLFCLLGFTGCTVSNRVQHQVYCTDNDERQTTFNVITAGDVSAFALRGRPFLVYRDAGTDKLEMIDVWNNDCEIR